MTPTDTTAAPRHPIRIVAERTGLTPEVLRAWERRYSVVRPGRGSGGHRLYSDADIQRLSLLAKVAARGRGIAASAALSMEELSRLVAEDGEHGRPEAATAADCRAEAMAAVESLSPVPLRAALRRGLLTLGTVSFLDELLGPLLTEIGDAWERGRIGVAHEHAASVEISQLLGWMIEELTATGAGPQLVLATTAGERHGLGAQMAGVAAALDGWKVTWIGSDLPAGQIVAAAERHHAEGVGLSVVNGESRGGASGEVTRVRKGLPGTVPILLGGRAAREARVGVGITTVRDLKHWRSLLRTLAPARYRAAV
jgi:DNA-binding transcriptional MerR regulator/methylmalonyl-CoA mutase cobalamin-binding subunit